MNNLDNSLMKLIYAVGKFQRQPKFTQGCSNLSPTEIKLFEIVKPKEKVTMGDISDALGTSKGASTILVNKLVKKKQLGRSYDEKDRRIVYISLTKDGEKTYRAYMECKHKVLGSISEALKPYNKETCIEIFDRLSELLET